MLDEFKLDGNIAIIAANGRSWTKEIAISLNKAGAKVVVATNNREKIAEINSNLSDKKILCIPTDLSSGQEIENMVKKTIARFGKIDILINNFNTEFVKPIIDMTEKEWYDVMQANVASVFLCCKSVGKQMIEQRSGSIINMVSGLAERGVSNGTAYCSSMGGVLQLTRALALEWANRNIRVNALGSGWMESDGARNEKDIISRYIPAHRRLLPEDVTPLVLFLASKASSYCSGNIFTADGGLMVRA